MNSPTALLLHWDAAPDITRALLPDDCALVEPLSPPPIGDCLCADIRGDFIDGAVLAQAADRCLIFDLAPPDRILRPLVLVAHPWRQWLAERTRPDCPDLSVFMAGYRRFAEWAVEIGFLRQEDLIRRPALAAAAQTRLGLPQRPVQFTGSLAAPTSTPPEVGLDYLLATTLLGYTSCP
ncbi:hypothetical protein [Magnetospirillum sp. 64-120]|uniref:hypothetical protein n=1 Tax=Magnetospirillum sp. 64-120 TaxID=1895778 RepID=UPI00092B2FF3|nr:hypothetical protein [Magnetospirillum sp. 64-120]OJX70343.1 MAG: hypothetical protein BGO92_17280 [Magnetospirillum sp. 64-120]